jgi:hypothetical protein
MGTSAESNDDVIEEESEEENNDSRNDEDGDTSRSEIYDAEEILQDLTDGESSKSEDFLESNLVLSVYKATKRRLEEAFYSSTRIHVVGDANSDYSNECSSSDRVDSQLYHICSKDSYDFTFENDQESEAPPILRVLDIDVETPDEDTQDVEVDDKGQILGEPPSKDVQCNEQEVSPQHTRRARKRSEKGMWKLNRQEGSFTGGSKKRTNVDKVSPPVKHILTHGMGDPSTFDEELTRNGTWDESIVNSTLQKDNKSEQISRNEHHVSVSFDRQPCCSEDL